MSWITIGAVPLLIAGLSLVLFKTISWKEFLIQVLVSIGVVSISVLIIYSSNVGDTEIWSGRVTKKDKEWTPCSHSYQCRCRTEETCSGSGKDRSCTSHEVCDTCYEHSNDWDWTVRTSNGEIIYIDRIDRQGANTPPRWESVQINEPTAQPHRYTSYIKAAPDSLFRHQGLTTKYAGTLPPYPGKVYDYYNLNRLVTQGVSVDNTPWNQGLMNINADMGSKKQVNMVVVLTDQDPEWFYALEESWIGGKKNDAILVIGVDPTGKKRWANVMAWTLDKALESTLSREIMSQPDLDAKSTLEVFRKVVEESYKRKPMADFSYLKASIRPTGTQYTIAIIINIIIAILLTLAFHFEVFDTHHDRYLPKFRRNVYRRNV